MLLLNQVHDAILIPQARGSVALPFGSQGLIPKPLNQSQSARAGDGYDILPFLVSLQYLDRKLGNALHDAAMLKYLPHTINSIHTIYGMSRRETVKKAA